MSFDPLTPNEPAAVSSAITASRQKRQLVDQAIDAARRADWTAAAEINQKILEMGPDSAAENRAAKACWEQGELGLAREHYQSALAIDPTNRIAERNIGRLRMLMVDAGSKTVPGDARQQGPRQHLRGRDRQDRFRSPRRPRQAHGPRAGEPG